MRILLAAIALLLQLSAAHALDGKPSPSKLARQASAAELTRAYLEGWRPSTPKGDVGGIRGRVIDSSTGEPLEFVTAFAFALPNFDAMLTAVTDANGEYEILVPPGQYRVSFAAGDGGENSPGAYTQEQYAGAIEGFPTYCGGFNFCFGGFGSTGPALDPVDVSLAGVDAINASLDPAAFVTGELQDSLGTRLPGDFNNIISIHDDQGFPLMLTFQLFDGSGFGVFLPLGSYVLYGESAPAFSLIDETHNGTHCPGSSCALELETPIIISSQGEAIPPQVIMLDDGARLSGAVIDGISMEVVPASAFIYATNGFFAGQALFNGTGFESISGLPDGTYFVNTVFQNSYLTRQPETEGNGIFPRTGQRLVDGLFDGFPCPNGCDPTLGTPVTVAGGDVTNGPINITVFPGGTIRGSVVAATDRSPVAGVAVRFFDGEGVLVNRVTSQADGSFAAGPFDADDYFVVTDAEGTGFVNQIFDGLACGGTQCDVDAPNGTPVTVTDNGEVTSIVLRLRAEQVLTPADVEALDEAGRAIAICGNRLYVGVPGDDDAGPDAGAVNAFVREGRDYVFDEKIFADEPENGDLFGAALACDDENLAIGAPGAGPPAKGGGGPGRKPAAYVLRLGGDPSEIQALVASNLSGAGSFGTSIDIDGDTMVVGAPQAGTGGAAIVFGGSSFMQESILQDPEASPGDGFGTAVATSEGLIVAGAPNQSFNGITSGLAELFEGVAGSHYRNVGKFTNPEAAADDSFGTSVAIEGTTLAVGAPGSDLSGEEDAGAAHVFVFDGQNVEQTAVLLASDPAAGAGLGDAVALNGDLLIAGAPQATGAAARTGAAYLFQQDGANWNQVDKFSSEASNTGDAFGSAVGFDGDQVAVGSPAADGDTGLATVFSNAETVFDASFE